MSVRFAARAMPHLAVNPHAWIEDQLPVQEWSVEFQRQRQRSTLNFGLPASEKSLLNSLFFVDPDDHSNDVGSLVHMYVDGYVDTNGDPAPVISFVSERRGDSQEEEATEVADFQAKHLLSLLDHASVLAYDFPRYPSVEIDWMYDADSILENGDFESGGTLNAIQAIYINEDIDGGTWDAYFEGNTASGLAWDITASALETALNSAWSTVISLSVTGDGSSDNPFHVEFTDPGGLPEPAIQVTSNLTASGGLSGTAIWVEIVQGGGQPGLGSWTKATGVDTGRVFGTYASDGFRIDDSRFHSADFSLYINGLSQFAGAQQIVRVIPGMRYRAGVWLSTDSATDLFRLVIRDRFEGLVAHSLPFEDTIDTPGVWKEFTAEFIAPYHTELLVFRFAYVGTGNPAPYWIDDAYLSPGGAAATIGAIWLELLDDAQTDHAALGRELLTYVTPTFDAVNDSAGNAWPGLHKMTINEGSTYGQLAEHHEDQYGYEFDLRYDTVADAFYFDIFNPGALGTSHPTNFPAIVVGPGVTGGEAVRSAPRGTHAFVRGSAGLWARTLTSTLTAAWGRRESHVAAPDAHDDWALNEILATEEARFLNDMIGLQYKMSDAGQSVPLRDFLPGDYLTTTPGSDTAIPSGSRRVETIRAAGRGGQVSDIDVHVGAEVFGSLGLAAQAEAVRRLLRKIRFTPPDTGGAVTFRGGGGGIPDVVLAAADTVFRDTADLVSEDYSFDSIMMAEAMTMVNAQGGGWIHLLQGTYEWAGSVTWDQGVRISGAAQGATTIKVADGANITSIFDLPTYAGNVNALDNREQVLENITLDGNKANGSTVSSGLLLIAATAVTRNVRIEKVQFINSSSTGIGGGSGNCLFTFNEVEVAHNNSHGLDMQNASHHHNCWYHDNGGDGFQDTAHGGTHYFTNCRIYNNGGNGIGVTSLLARARLVVLGCSIFSNSGLGISQGYLASASIIIGNVVTSNTGQGINVHPDSIVRHNIVSGNGNDTSSPADTEASIDDIPTTAPQVITFSLLGELGVGSGTSRFVVPRAGTIQGVRVGCGVAPTGADVIVDLNKNGNTAYTTQANRPTCPDGSNQGSETVPAITSVADGDYLTVDIDQVGSTTPGENITVMVDIAWTLTPGA